MDARLATARLYLVTGRIDPARLRACLDGGVDLVQLRLKDAADDAELLREATWMRAACADADVPFLLNDRPDLVRAAGADGVHVGQDDAPLAAARTAVGAACLVGLSTHAPPHLAALTKRGQAPFVQPDYVAVGPVHATPTKPGRAAVGLEYVRYAAAHVPPELPWFAIGGIDVATVGAVAEAGALRIAVVRALTEARDPAGVAAALLAALPQAVPA